MPNLLGQKNSIRFLEAKHVDVIEAFDVDELCAGRVLAKVITDDSDELSPGMAKVLMHKL